MNYSIIFFIVGAAFFGIGIFFNMTEHKPKGVETTGYITKIYKNGPKLGYYVKFYTDNAECERKSLTYSYTNNDFKHGDKVKIKYYDNCGEITVEIIEDDFRPIRRGEYNAIATSLFMAVAVILFIVGILVQLNILY